MRLAPRHFCLAALIALGACKGGDATLKDKAEGEILPGSVSDAMLPLDTVRSEPPLAPHSEVAGKAGRKSAAGAPADDAEAPAVEASAAVPAPTPTPATPQAAASAAN